MFLFGRFDDFDDAIDEAIEEDIRDLCDGEWTMWGLKPVDYSQFHSHQPLTPNIQYTYTGV